jgi:membrane-associated phospholipid phosphatase
MQWLTSLFFHVGGNGPFFLMAFSLFLLRNKPNLCFYYFIGLTISAILNVGLKGLFQQLRPLFHNPKSLQLVLNYGKHHLYRNYIPFDMFGMPSGHAQSSFFSTVFVFLSLHNISLGLFFGLISLIVMLQRVVFQFHSLFQVLVGAFVGGIVAYFIFHFAQQKMKGKIQMRIDDFAPF